MPKSIQIRLEKASNGLIYQVLEQPSELRWLGIGKFRASNGWTIETVDYPEIDLVNKHIFIRGEDQDLDSSILLVLSDEGAEVIETDFNDIIKAFNEFVLSDVYKQAVRAPDVVQPTQSVFKFG